MAPSAGNGTKSPLRSRFFLYYPSAAALPVIVPGARDRAVLCYP